MRICLYTGSVSVVMLSLMSATLHCYAAEDHNKHNTKASNEVVLPRVPVASPVAVPTPSAGYVWGNVRLVDWSQSGNRSFLAVGDNDASTMVGKGVYIYSFNGIGFVPQAPIAVPAQFTMSAPLTVPAPSESGWGNIRSLSWGQCGRQSCLAIADNDPITMAGKGVYIYRFNGPRFIAQDPVVVPAPSEGGWGSISSVAWCHQGRAVYLAVADNNPSAMAGKGVYIYTFNPSGTVTQSPVVVPAPAAGWGSIATLAWCHSGGQACLAVGTATSPLGVYTYRFNGTGFATDDPIVAPAPAAGWGSVSSVAWCSQRNRQYLAVGTVSAPQGAYIYRFNGSQFAADDPVVVPAPSGATGWSNISSVAWGYGYGRNSYLAINALSSPDGAYVYRFNGLGFAPGDPLVVPAPASGWSNVYTLAWCSMRGRACLALGDFGPAKGAYIVNFAGGLFNR